MAAEPSEGNAVVELHRHLPERHAIASHHGRERLWRRWKRRRMDLAVATTHAELVPLPLSELPLEKVSVAAGAFLRHSPRVEQVGQATTAQLIDQPTPGLGKMLTAVIAGDVMGLVLGVLAQMLPLLLQLMLRNGGWRRRRWWWWRQSGVAIDGWRWWCWWWWRRSGVAIDGCTVAGSTVAGVGLVV